MQVKQLFQHHTGRMPAPARWYLALAAMAVLILLAAHFAMQAHIQKRMRVAVEGMLAELGGSAEQVRYRLLRGALTVSGVRAARNKRVIVAPHIYLHASTSSMFSKHPHFSVIRLDEMDISLPRDNAIRWLKGESSSPAPQLIAATGYVEKIMLEHARIRFAGDQGGWSIQEISGWISPSAFNLSGISNGGDLHLRGEAMPGTVRGIFSWEHVITLRLARALGIHARPDGASSGILRWQAEGTARRLSVHGEITLQDQPKAGKITVQGQAESGNIALQAQCEDVSLRGFSALLPVLNARHVQSGFWNGDVAVTRQGEKERLQVRMDGEIHQLLLASNALPAWILKHVVVSKAVADLSTRSLHAGRVEIHGAKIGLLTGRAGQVEPSWNLKLDKLEFDGTRPILSLTEGTAQFVFPALKGSGRMTGDGAWTIDALSDGDETWKFHTEGLPGGRVTARIEADHIAVVRLRPFLPGLSLPGNTGMPRLAGSGRLQLAVTSEKDRAWFTGQVVFSDFALSQGGDTFSAATARIDIQRAGMVEKQILGPVRIEGWHYQAALHPIPRSVDKPAVQPGPVQRQALPWQVGEIVATHGVLSVGSRRSVWARNISVSIKGLQAGKMSPLALDAWFGGGYLRLHGQVNLFSSTPAIRLKARLSGALPFFLNNWLAVSGAPRLLRGRLDGSFSIKPFSGTGDYTGRLHLVLHRGQFEDGAFPQDPLLPLTGFGMRTLSHRLSRGHRLELSVPFKGKWRTQPFSLRKLGLASLQVLKQRAASARPQRLADNPAPLAVAHVRLQQGRAFSHNEHARLWQIVKLMKKHTGLIVELLPQLGQRPLDTAWIARVRHTQGMISHYMRRRGVAKRRIFPVWPGNKARTSDASGIKIAVRRP